MLGWLLLHFVNSRRSEAVVVDHLNLVDQHVKHRPEDVRRRRAVPVLTAFGSYCPTSSHRAAPRHDEMRALLEFGDPVEDSGLAVVKASPDC